MLLRGFSLALHLHSVNGQGLRLTLPVDFYGKSCYKKGRDNLQAVSVQPLILGEPSNDCPLLPRQSFFVCRRFA